MTAAVFDIEKRLKSAPLEGRATSQRLFRNQRIDCIPLEEGIYVARSALLPEMLLAENEPADLPKETGVVSDGSGDRI